MKKEHPKVAILLKYSVFLIGCGLVLAGLSSYFYNPVTEQIVYSALAAILGALFITLGLSNPPKETLTGPEYETENLNFNDDKQADEKTIDEALDEDDKK